MLKHFIFFKKGFLYKKNHNIQGEKENKGGKYPIVPALTKLQFSFPSPRPPA